MPIAGVFINLERSADRRKRFIDSATKQTGSCFGSNATEKERKTGQIERIVAVDGKSVTSPIKGVTNNEYACIQSHLKALMYARENKLPCIAIFEDDVLFTDSFEKDFKYYLSVMPQDWHILYLGGSFGRRPSYFDEHFTQQNMTWGAFAYVVHERAYDALINMFSRANKIADAILIDYQKTYLCLKPAKKLVVHPKGFSTIKEIEVDYKNIQ